MFKIHAVALCAGMAFVPALAMADEADTLAKAKLSITSAISAAETASGGKVMEIDLDEEKDAPVFEASVFTGGQLKHYKIDATSSTGVAVENKSLKAKVDFEGKAEKEAIMQAKTSMQDAIATVEKDTGGKAYKAEVEVEDKRSEYVIEVVANGKEMKKFVDAGTGKIVN